MSEKRRDSKGRMLRTGEGQRPNGQYSYVWTDSNGKKRTIYSWRLERRDKVPNGKRDCRPLRELEREAQRDVEDGIIGTDATVLQYVETYLQQKMNIRSRTQKTYENSVARIKKYRFAKMKITDVKPIHCKQFIAEMKKDGFKYNTIIATIRFVKSVFNDAVTNDFIRKNPFQFKINAVIPKEEIEDRTLSEEEMNRFLSFCKSDYLMYKHYDLFYFMFYTGLREGEICGLTRKNVDMGNHVIHITQQMAYNNGAKHIMPLKTKTSCRDLPMLGNVYEILLRQFADKDRPQSTIIDGQYDFVFCSTTSEEPLMPDRIRAYVSNAMRRYNEKNPNHRINISPHVFRHTFCSVLIRHNVSIKTVQYLMGHASANITLDVYTKNYNLEEVKRELKQRIG